MELCLDCGQQPATHTRPRICQNCWDQRYRYNLGKRCPDCGRPMLNWATRCHDCAPKARARPVEKTCPTCGKNFTRTRDRTAYCSIRCANLGQPRQATAERFWEKVDKRGPDECWEWRAGANDDDGYGAFEFNGTRILAHRMAYMLTSGDIPPGMLVCHTCDNPPCCNPGHFFLGTDADNSDDMMAKSRNKQPQGERHGRSKLTAQDVTDIRSAADGKRGTVKFLAERFGVHPLTISRVIHRKLWKTI